MKALNLTTLILLIVGGLNWGLVGLLSFDLVAAIFGSGSMLSRLVYVAVGASAVWQVVPLLSALRGDQGMAARGSAAR
jgi:uncharacterized membrane protein YuzA (DUF378 family)